MNHTATNSVFVVPPMRSEEQVKFMIFADICRHAEGENNLEHGLHTNAKVQYEFSLDVVLVHT